MVSKIADQKIAATPGPKFYSSFRFTEEMNSLFKYEEIYRSDAFHIFSVKCASERVEDDIRRVFVSFPMRDGCDEAFGEVVFTKNKIDVIYVTCVDGSWFQYPDTVAAAEAIRAATSMYGEVINYGTSMGGYGALAFSGHIKATTIISCSPQYSIDTTKVPFENRYLNDVPRVVAYGGFRCDDLGRSLSYDARLIIMFDPFDDMDKKHAALVQNHRKGERLLVPFSGHKSLIVLREMGLASELVKSAASGTLEVNKMRQSIRSRRWRSLTYLRFLARMLHKKKFSGILTILYKTAEVKDDDNWDGLRTDIRLAIEYGANELAVRQIKKLLRLRVYVKRHLIITDFFRWLPKLSQTISTDKLKELFEDIPLQQPELRHVNSIIALIHALMKDDEKVNAYLSQSKPEPISVEYLNAAAEIRLIQGEINELKVAIEALLEKEPGNLRFINILSDQLFRQERRDEALLVLQRAAMLVELPAHPHRYRLGKLLELDKQFDKALEEANVIIKNNSRDPLGHRLRGGCLAQLQRHVEACEAYRQVIDNPHHVVHACYGLAVSQVALRHSDDALQTIQKGLKIDPESKPLNKLLASLIEASVKEVDRAVIKVM